MNAQQFQFHRATKEQLQLRLALIGPSGSGKTYTALAIATALGGRIALLDTEHGSAKKYGHLFEFDTLELDSFSPENYMGAIAAAQAAGYQILIIDSLSHAWAGKDGLLEFVDREAAKAKGDSFGAGWRKATPLHNRLIDAMLSAELHLIVCLRSKMEYLRTEDEKGKTVIKKVGLQPVQRDGLEYEFDVVADLDVDNNLIVGKTRCPELRGYMQQCDGAPIAAKLLAWLNTGVAPARRPANPTPPPGNGNGGNSGNGGETVPEERKRAAHDLWERVVAAARAAGWKRGAGDLLKAMQYPGLLAVLAVAERDGENVVMNQMLDVVFPWPEQVITVALETMPHYQHRNHVLNALNLSGLPRTRDQGELLDWLSSHAKERQSPAELAEQVAETIRGGAINPWDEEEVAL